LNPSEDWTNSLTSLLNGDRYTQKYLEKYLRGTILYRKAMFLKGYFNLLGNWHMPRLYFQMLDPEPQETDIIHKYQGYPIVAVVHVLEDKGQTKIRCANKTIMKWLGWHFSNSHVIRDPVHRENVIYETVKVAKPHTTRALEANQGFVKIHDIQFFCHYEEY